MVIFFLQIYIISINLSLLILSIVILLVKLTNVLIKLLCLILMILMWNLNALFLIIIYRIIVHLMKYLFIVISHHKIFVFKKLIFWLLVFIEIKYLLLCQRIIMFLSPILPSPLIYIVNLCFIINFSSLFIILIKLLRLSMHFLIIIIWQWFFRYNNFTFILKFGLVSIGFLPKNISH